MSRRQPPLRSRRAGGGPELYLGVDLGTTGLKLGAFDAQGACLAAGRREYPLDSPYEGWAEQSAELWWQAFRDSLRQVGERVDLMRVAAICVVGQGPTVVAVDEAGASLRPAITWADRRAVAEASWLGEKLGSGQVSVEFDILPRIVWIREHEPELFSRVRWFFQSYDYLAFRLTGKPITIEPLERLPPWTDQRLALAGLDRSLFPRRMVPPGRLVGPLGDELAAGLGLPQGTAVVSGTVDAFAHWIGVDLTAQGRLCNIGGTSEGVALSCGECLHDPQFRVFGLHSPFGEGWVVGGSMSNGGGLLDWATRCFGGAQATRASLLAGIERVPPGAEGLLALPYFLGERTPIYDSAARGCFFGAHLGHGAPHFGRALLEGVAFGLRQIVEILEEIGGEAGELTVTGGTARAEVWNRIKADVTGRRVRVPTVTDSGVLGAAVLARSAACGLPLAEASGQMVSYAEVIEPNTENARTYDRLYPLFLELYQELREPYRRLARLGLARPSGPGPPGVPPG